jgi:hypothetical protein
MTYDEELAEVEVEEVKAETEKAILCLVETGDLVWVPKSVIHEDSEVYSKRSGCGTLVVPAWFAKKSGLA